MSAKCFEYELETFFVVGALQELFGDFRDSVDDMNMSQ